ncbi:Clavaminate synthase-like protein [Mycena belliarum]|uniref:Clavaminate synthase-like protein n=1 Tax=Mycena belliarum TaxID=1033014 RepID=A0AAD6XM36_9AGAR|nr:Clavaminate synthase-like protein [Mycena belliae]
MARTHSEIPLLDLTLAQRDRPAFLAQLRDMLVAGGFVYLTQTPVPPAAVDRMVASTAQFFDLPTAVKDAVDMNGSAHFNGYLRKGAAENPIREQFNYGDEHVALEAGAPEYHKIHGGTPWPDDALFPGCRAAMAEYYTHLKRLSVQFTRDVAEALGLAPDALEPLFEADVARRQLRCKILRYPACPPATTGFVPHTDSNFLTYLLQASDEPGLELRKPSGEWFPAPPIPGTFIVLVGRVLEKVTRGLLKAPLHRVVSPTQGTRYSVGFFQGVAMDTRIADANFEFPQTLLDIKRARQEREGDETEYADRMPAGEVVLNFKLKAHPLVAYRFYPTLFPNFYPDGLPERYANLVH